jgi:hypothetical protein
MQRWLGKVLATLLLAGITVCTLTASLWPWIQLFILWLTSR